MLSMLFGQLVFWSTGQLEDEFTKEMTNSVPHEKLCHFVSDGRVFMFNV